MSRASAPSATSSALLDHDRAGHERRGLFHRLGIVGADFGALGDELLHDGDGHAAADVVGVALEGEAEHADFLLAQDPERFADFLEEAFLLVGVDLLDFLQQREFVAEFARDADEGGDVLREARAAVADAGVEEGAADALVRAHAVGDALDVGAGGLADGGDGVDVGNLEGEEAVRGVLDQLGRVEVGDHDRRVEGLVDFASSGAMARSEETPTTMRSGFIKSSTAEPSRRNSGLLTTSMSAPGL